MKNNNWELMNLKKQIIKLQKENNILKVENKKYKKLKEEHEELLEDYKLDRGIQTPIAGNQIHVNNSIYNSLVSNTTYPSNVAQEYTISYGTYSGTS